MMAITKCETASEKNIYEGVNRTKFGAATREEEEQKVNNK